MQNRYRSQTAKVRDKVAEEKEERCKNRKRKLPEERTEAPPAYWQAMVISFLV